MYLSPSQTSADFNSFSTNLEKLVFNISSSNPYFILIIGDFNAKFSNWSFNDTTTADGARLNYLKQLYGMKEVFFFFETSFICIDLIFSNQPKLIMDSGAHPALHSKCHHQIIYSKIKLKVEYPSPSTCKICDFNSSETDLINRSVEFFDLLNLF